MIDYKNKIIHIKYSNALYYIDANNLIYYNHYNTSFIFKISNSQFDSAEFIEQVEPEIIKENIYSLADANDICNAYRSLKVFE